MTSVIKHNSHIDADENDSFMPRLCRKNIFQIIRSIARFFLPQCNIYIVMFCHHFY